MEEIIDPFGGINPPCGIPKRRAIDVRGRREHEAFIKDSAKCKEHGIDQVYETIVYLNRWGGWLNGQENG